MSCLLTKILAENYSRKKFGLSQYFQVVVTVLKESCISRYNLIKTDFDPQEVEDFVKYLTMIRISFCQIIS